MLIEFRVKNFNSIRDEVTFSMVANHSKELRDTNVIDSEFAGVPDLVRSAAIYGPNGAGKTSVISAMRFMADYVSGSASSIKPNEKILIVPFLLDAQSSVEPSEFEVIFVATGVRYQYGFALTEDRVVDEWLYAAPEGRNQTWIERTFADETNDYQWKIGSYLKGQKRLIRESTRENALYLSTGAQLNNEQLLTVWTWFNETLRAFPGKAPLSEGFTSELCADDNGNRKKVVKFLQDAAIDVEDISVRSENIDEDRSSRSNKSERQNGRSEDSPEKSLEPFFSHKVHGTDYKIDFPLIMESAGTQYVYAWAGPWIDVLERGLVLVLDEVDASLHTHLAQYLIGLFHDPDINASGAQLIFTTHSTPILGNRMLLRRDQVWFVHKDQYNGTQLSAFIDFHPRKGEDREKNYLSGRYGAIPELAARKH